MKPGADEFGDRMKAYEATADLRLDPRLPIVARIDGRSFSRFTRGMDRPFDPDMSAAMAEAAAKLVDATHARIGYTQSDEISLIYGAVEDAETAFFAGRVQKLCSVLAGLATAAFTAAILSNPRLKTYASRLPHFDCRAYNVPSETEAANAILWRELDATKNAVSMAGRAHFSAKQMHGQGTADLRQMLARDGVDFESYPTFFKRGTYLRRVTFERAFAPDELARIPERHRPAADALVTRSEVRTLDIPPFVMVANREDVVFRHATPELANEAA